MQPAAERFWTTLDQHAGIREPVEQRGLAGVGVAGDRDAGDVVATARLALDVAGAAQVLELLAQLGDPGVDAASVGLDLRLTGAAATDAVTAGGATAGLHVRIGAPDGFQPAPEVVARAEAIAALTGAGARSRDAGRTGP